MTLKALSFIDNLTTESQILDLGCGTGGQTMVMAQHALGNITGMDLFPEFIELFNANAARLNLQDKVKGIVGSMDDPPLDNEKFDLIWSERAIYNIGFKRGLSEWRKYLKIGGCIQNTNSITVMCFILGRKQIKTEV
jgi:ubiquinone/menaquinone biosynthesis C-methylase UbiE